MPCAVPIMTSKITKDRPIRWKGRIQKLGQMRQKLFDTRAAALGWEATTDTVCSLKSWAERYLGHAAKYDRKTFNEKRQALQKLFAATIGQGKAVQLIVNPLAPVASLTPGKVLAALRVQFESRSGNTANKDRKHLMAAWNWGIRYLGFAL